MNRTIPPSFNEALAILRQKLRANNQSTRLRAYVDLERDDPQVLRALDTGVAALINRAAGRRPGARVSDEEKDSVIGGLIGDPEKSDLGAAWLPEGA